MSPQRILHIVGRMDRAGAETMLMNLYREIDRAKYQFDFLYFTDEPCDYDEEIKALGGNIIRINSRSTAKRFFTLYKTIKQGDWQIIHSHTLFSSGLNLFAGKLANASMLVAHSHNTSDANSSSITGRFYQHAMRWLLSWVPTHYIACGKAAARYLFLNRNDVRIIPNAINIEQFINAQGHKVKTELGIDEKQLIILQVGRLMPVKNHIFSVKIASILKDTRTDFQMLFVGTGAEQQSIESLINQLGLEKHVRLLSLRDDIPELMAAANVMLMPSLHEGFPVVLVESQAAGLPAVIADTISSEVDLNIDLVNFISLNSPLAEWASTIKAIAEKNKIPVETRIKTLEEHGFSARSGAKRLMTIYNS